MSKTYDILIDNGVFFIATIDKNKPALRPFGAIMEYNNELYFSTSTSKKVYDQIKSSSSIEIVSLKTGSRDWLRVSGDAIEIYDISLKQIMLDRCPVLNNRFTSNSCPNFALFKIINMNSIWHKTNETIILK